MPFYNSGIQTKRDAINIHFTKKDALDLLNSFEKLEEAEIRKKYNLSEDGRDWSINLAKKDIKNNPLIHLEQYRPFDYRFSFYTGKSKGIVAYPRQIVSKHIIGKENHNLCLMRQFFQDTGFSHVLYSNKMVDERTMYSNRGGTYVFPLYLYPDTSKNDAFQSNERKPNLNEEIVNQIAKKLGLKFTNEKEIPNQVGNDNSGTFAPIDLLDYIYAVLHSPSYRDKFKEFLKIDFPRVPYPKDVETFWNLVKLGGEIRQIHLLESPVIEKYITQYPISGDNIVRKIKFIPYPKTKTEDSKSYSQLDCDETPLIAIDNTSFPQPHLSSNDDMLLHEPNEDYTTKGDLGLGKVYINDNQFFDNVPQLAWDFYIGGYQPAKKWLKDRKERKLEFDDILHYQKIIVALTETNRLMKEIDKIDIE